MASASKSALALLHIWAESSTAGAVERCAAGCIGLAPKRPASKRPMDRTCIRSVSQCLRFSLRYMDGVERSACQPEFEQLLRCFRTGLVRAKKA